jgi:hypothetical protein
MARAKQFYILGTSGISPTERKSVRRNGPAVSPWAVGLLLSMRKPFWAIGPTGRMSWGGMKGLSSGRDLPPHKILFGAGNDDIGLETTYFWGILIIKNLPWPDPGATQFT